MAFDKILWVVNYDKLSDFVAEASAAKVTGVAIRTDNDLDAAITAFHAKNIKVYGWRWPSAPAMGLDGCSACRTGCRPWWPAAIPSAAIRPSPRWPQ